MDDIDRDIERAGRGKKRETAYETMKHSKIPATNLPPLSSRPRNYQSKNRPVITKDQYVYGTDWDSRRKCDKEEQCRYKINVDDEGTTCGKPATHYCTKCGKPLCSEHISFVDHNCPMVFY
jgi:hypothetical protein